MSNLENEMVVKRETIIGFVDILKNFAKEAEWLIDYRLSSKQQRIGLDVPQRVFEWSDKATRLVVAREKESPHRVLGVLYGSIFFQPNVGHGFVVEDVLMRRELASEQKRQATIGLFSEFQKLNADLGGANFFSICSRGFHGSQLEQWVIDSGVHFTSFNLKAYIYSLDLTNSELVQKLLAKKAKTEENGYRIREAVTDEDGDAAYEQYKNLEIFLKWGPDKMPHDRETFVSNLMHSGSTKPDGVAYNGAYLVEDCSTTPPSVFGTLVWTATFAPSRGGQFGVNTLFVDAAKRRGGVGTQLLVLAVEKALALGCHIIDLVVDISNNSGASFYKQCGFVDNTDIEQCVGHFVGEVANQ